MFNSVTLDGFFSGENGDMSWAHTSQDAEWNAFVEGNAKGGGVLVFGRTTYDLTKKLTLKPTKNRTFRKEFLPLLRADGVAPSRRGRRR